MQPHDQMKEFEKNSIEFQTKMIAVIEEYTSKLPADVILLAMASIMGKMFGFPGFAIKRNRLKTILKEKIGL